MKKILPLTFAALAVLAAPLARAWPYQDGDALLIFRESGFNDVEFDLGNVSQFTGLPYGTTITVNNWDRSLVTNTFGSDLTGVSVVLAGSTSRYDANRAAWLSSGDPTAVAYTLTASDWQFSLWSTINSIGTRPLIYLVPTAGASAYSIDPGGTYKLASYDAIVSPNGGSLPQFGGNASFTVEQVIPGTFGLWQIQPSAANPKPPAIFVGTFTIDAGGGLTFTAGPPRPGALGIVRSSGVNTVNFTTAVGGNYWLAYTNALGGPVSTWPLVSGPLVGDGNPHALNHTASDANGFYSVVRVP
jgi:hypothetical protein